jgi:sodium/hydrogen antiporter
MTESTFAVVALLVLAWAVVSKILARVNINGPLLFTVAGFTLANPEWGPLSVGVEAPSIHLIAEVTLALLLFADASRVDVSELRHDVWLPARLLAISLPLSVIVGALLAVWLLDDLTWALALFVGAALAPTDAALSAQVINDERIPTRVRRLLNVESGLNDGIVTPVVTFALVVAASQMGAEHHDGASGGALLDLAVGVGTGLVVGAGSGALVSLGSRRDWIVSGGRRLAILGAALGSFGLAVAVDGNGFLAAFVAGLSFGAAADDAVLDVDELGELPELLGEVLSFVVWFLFGALLAPLALSNLNASTVVYAVLSLTAVRMAPVALAMVRSRADAATVAFTGWFGPRGLASVVFALLAVEQLSETPAVVVALTAVSLTVLSSVVLHGVSAGPLGSRYRQLEAGHTEGGSGPRARRSSGSGQ